MGIIGWIKGVFGKKPNNEELREVKAYAAYGEASRPLSEHEIVEQLGINYHMIHDDAIERVLEGSALREPNGEEEDNPSDRAQTLAIRVLMSNLIRTSYVDPYDAEINKLKAERDIGLIELDMDEDSYEFGGSNLLNAFATIIKTAWDDAKNGRKAKLLKVMPRTLEIRTGTEEQSKKGGRFL